MPAMLPAAAASTALGTGAAIGAGIGGAGLALGGGIAAGTALAGGTGLVGLLGGLGGAGAGAAGSMLGGAALTPAVASLAPAATAQAMGPSMLQSAGLEALKGKVIGSGVQQAATQQASNLAIQQAAAQNMAGGLANPMSQMGAKFLANSPYPVANANNLNFLNSSVAGGTNVMPAETFGSQTASGTGNLAETIRNTNTAMRGNVPISYAEGAQGIAPNAIAAPTSGIQPGQNFMQNLGNISSFQDVKDYADTHPYATSAMAGLGAMGIAKMMEPKKIPTPESNPMIRPYTYERTQRPEAYETSPGIDSSERLYFNDQFTPLEPYKATEKAEGGIASAYAMGGPVEQMAAMNAVGANTGYPMAGINTPVYSNPMMQRPEATNVIAPSADAGVGTYSGEPRFAEGGISGLGGYSDGGRLLKGPGDGVSDSIPASIGGRQPARLADGEFVVPARIVSELGNGSTEAGARKLYAMMERVQASRKKSIGKKKVAVNSKADKHLPA